MCFFECSKYLLTFVEIFWRQALEKKSVKFVKSKSVLKFKFAFRISETKALQKKTVVSKRNSLTPL